MYVPSETSAKQYVWPIVFSILPTIFVALRFYVRRMTKNELRWDDWWIVVAMVFTYLTGAFMIVGTTLGNEGQHMEFTPEGMPIPSERFTWFLKMLYAGQLSQIIAIGCTKLSVLLLYRRIFRGNVFDLITWALIALVTGWMIAFFFANLLECVPIDHSWMSAPGQGLDPHCIDALPMYFAGVYSDVVLDFLILAVPIPFVWRLNLPTKQKIAVTGIFLLGFITIMSSAAKSIIFNYVGHDFLTPIVYWPMIESGLQIVAGCLPLLRPLVQKLSHASVFSNGSLFRNLLKSRSTHRKESTDNSYLHDPSDVDLELSLTGDPKAAHYSVNASNTKSHTGTAVRPAEGPPVKGIWVQNEFNVHE